MQNILYAFKSWTQNDVLSHNRLFSGLNKLLPLFSANEYYDFQLSKV